MWYLLNLCQKGFGAGGFRQAYSLLLQGIIISNVLGLETSGSTDEIFIGYVIAVTAYLWIKENI